MNRFESTVRSALQLWSIRRGLLFDPETALARAKDEAEFGFVEVAGTWGKRKGDFAAMLSDFDLNVVGIHAAPPSLDILASKRDFESYYKYLVNEASVYSTTRIVLMRDPELPPNRYLTLIRAIDRAAVECGKEGIQVLFHPYQFDWTTSYSGLSLGDKSYSFVALLAKFPHILFQIDIYYLALAAEEESTRILEFTDGVLRQIGRDRIVSMHANGWRASQNSNQKLSQAPLSFDSDLQNCAARVFGLSSTDCIILEHDSLDISVDQTGFSTEDEVQMEWDRVLASLTSEKSRGTAGRKSPFERILELWRINSGRH